MFQDSCSRHPRDAKIATVTGLERCVESIRGDQGVGAPFDDSFLPWQIAIVSKSAIDDFAWRPNVCLAYGSLRHNRPEMRGSRDCFKLRIG